MMANFLPQNTTTKDEDKYIPQALIECEILPRLRFKTLQQFKCVSKTYQSFVTSPDFAYLHWKHARENLALVFYDCDSRTLFTYDIKDILAPPSRHQLNSFKNIDRGIYFGGSSNGLMCFYSEDSKGFSYSFYNPTTRVESFSHFLCTEDDGDDGDEEEEDDGNDDEGDDEDDGININEGHGFGFDAENNDFKCVTIYRQEVYVFSSKTSSIEKIRYFNSNFCLIDETGVSAKNSLHWIYGDTKSCLGVYSIELRTNTCFETPFPSSEGPPRLVTIGGSLHVVFPTFDRIRHFFHYKIDVWVMKEYGGSSWCPWVKLFNLDMGKWVFSTIPTSFSEGGRKVLSQVWKYTLGEKKKRYVWYDMITKKLEKDVYVDVETNWIPLSLQETLIDQKSFQLSS